MTEEGTGVVLFPGKQGRMEQYVLVERVNETTNLCVVQGLQISFLADLNKLRSLPYEDSEFKWIKSETFEFIQDGAQYRCHLKVQEQISSPGYIGIFLHHDELEEEGMIQPPPLCLHDWELGVLLPDGQRVMRKMKNTTLGLYGMGWPDFVGPKSIPSDASSLEVLAILNKFHNVSLHTSK